VTGIDGDVNGLGYRADMFGGFDWVNKEVRISSRQGNGVRRTKWKEVFRGLCDEPTITSLHGRPMLEIVVREKYRRRLQMSHLVRGYSDNAAVIDGIVMNEDVQGIMEDICAVVGLWAENYNIAALPLTPRSWQIMGESALDAFAELADQAVLAVCRNSGDLNPGRIEVREWAWGSQTPRFWPHADSGVVGIEWTEGDMGLTAQVVETVQHSEFAEFSDIYPHAPVPPFGAVIRHNASIAQDAGDINATRLLQYLRWKVLNRELHSVVIHMVGQDWLEHDIETQPIDYRVLGLDTRNQYYVIDGWQYNWSPTEGFRASIHLVNQEPHKTIMKGKLEQTVQVSY